MWVSNLAKPSPANDKRTAARACPTSAGHGVQRPDRADRAFASLQAASAGARCASNGGRASRRSEPSCQFPRGPAMSSPRPSLVASRSGRPCGVGLRSVANAQLTTSCGCQCSRLALATSASLASAVRPAPAAAHLCAPARSLPAPWGLALTHDNGPKTERPSESASRSLAPALSLKLPDVKG